MDLAEPHLSVKHCQTGVAAGIGEDVTIRSVLVFLVLAVGCGHTAAEKQGMLARKCETWDGFADPPERCRPYLARRAAYDKDAAESAKRLSEVSAVSPRKACLLRAERDFGACVGDTPLGSAHPAYGADEEDTSPCRHRFDVAATICGTKPETVAQKAEE